MKVLDRLALLARADAHGVMDQLEEQSLLLKQHLRDAELALGQKRARLAAMREERTELNGRRETLEAEVGRIDEDVELAMRGGKEELARFAIQRLLPRREVRDRVAHELAHIDGEISALEERVRKQAGTFEDLKTRVRGRLEQLERRARHRENPVEGVGWSHAYREASAEEVDLELLRRASDRGRAAADPSDSTNSGGRS